jgi:hypothetical protein
VWRSCARRRRSRRRIATPVSALEREGGAEKLADGCDEVVALEEVADAPQEVAVRLVDVDAAALQHLHEKAEVAARVGVGVRDERRRWIAQKKKPHSTAVHRGNNLSARIRRRADNKLEVVRKRRDPLDLERELRHSPGHPSDHFTAKTSLSPEIMSTWFAA